MKYGSIKVPIVTLVNISDIIGLIMFMGERLIIGIALIGAQLYLFLTKTLHTKMV